MRVCSACKRLLTSSAKHCGSCGGPAEAVTELPAGALVGPYKIVRVLGEGGMGFVYEAVHSLLNRRTAIKFLRPEFAGDADVVARFMQEAKAVNVINHEHIVNIYDYGDAADGSAYFVMEFLDGETLGDLIHRRSRLPLPLVLHVFRQLMKALAAAHAKKIVHRDLKPANVLIVRREDDPFFVKLLDFGVAKLRGEGKVAAMTRVGTVMGTPQYMSPEQVQGLDVDARSDVWALGVMLYRACTGHLPFKGDSFQELGAKILTETPVPPREEAPDAGIPATLERLILHALERDTDKRTASIDAMLAGLEKVAAEAHLDDEALRACLVSEAAVSAATPEPPTSMTSNGSLAASNPLYQGVPQAQPAPAFAPPPRRSSRRALMVAGAVALAALGGVAAARFGGGGGSTAAAATAASVAPAGPVLTEGGNTVDPAGADAAYAPADAEKDLRAALASGDLGLQNDAVSALALVGSPRGASMLYLALGGGPELRLHAARALRDLRLPEAAPRLRAALDASGDRLRVELAACLYVLGDQDARAILVAALDDPAQRGLAAAAFAESARTVAADQQKAHAILSEVLAGAPAGRESWRRAAAALVRLGDAEARAALAADLTNPDPARAIAAADALAQAGDADARAYLGRVVADESFTRRGEAALALARLGDAGALVWIDSGLASSDAGERKLAVATAARLGQTAAPGGKYAGVVATLAAKDSDRGVRLTAQAALLGR